MSKHYKPKNSLMSPRFSGVKTFMRMELVEDESVLDDVDFAVLGIPFDTCATFRVGCRQGPASIREMSALAAKPYSGPLGVDIFEECSGVDYGDLGPSPATSRTPSTSSRRACCPSSRRASSPSPWAATTP